VPATEERRDTYDSRRIDGLVSQIARLEERVDNMKEAMRDQAASSRGLRNSIYAGAFMLTLSTLAGIVVPRVLG
jgi:hypothetical protein